MEAVRSYVIVLKSFKINIFLWLVVGKVKYFGMKVIIEFLLNFKIWLFFNNISIYDYKMYMFVDLKVMKYLNVIYDFVEFCLIFNNENIVVRRCLFA